MSNTKNASIREKVIDQCLSSGESMSTKEIMDKVNKELIARGEKPITYSGTITKDILFIADKAKVVIDVEKKGKSNYYKYSDKTFSLHMTSEKLSILRRVNQLIEMLNDFKGLPTLEWLEEFKAKLEASTYGEMSDAPIVTFSYNPDYAYSMRHFAPLYDYIKSKTAIEFTYKKFTDKEERTYVVHPYHLKEYQNRWYLYATVDHHPDSLACYAFDRMVGFKKSDKKYIENTRYDFKTYFDQILGVTIHPDMVPEEILLWVKEKEYSYLMTNPIHTSQKYVRDADGGKIISLNLCINYELEMRIFSYSEDVIVLSPKHLADKIRNKISNMQDLYNKFHSEDGIDEN